MTEARQRFLSLALPSEGLEKSAKDTFSRIGYALANGHYPARQPHRIAIELEEMEVGQAILDHAALNFDASLRNDAVSGGKVVKGHISKVDQPKPGRKSLLDRSDVRTDGHSVAD